MPDKEAVNEKCLLCDRKVAIRTVPSRSMDTLADIIMVSCEACGYDVQLDAESDDPDEVIEGLIEISYLEGQAAVRAKALMDADQPTLKEEIGRLDPNEAVLIARVLGSEETFDQSDLEVMAKVERIREALRSRFLPN